MQYSIIPALALMVNIILNLEPLKNAGIRVDKKSLMQQTSVRYGQFLVAANCFYFTDIVWGIAYESHDISGTFPIIYIDTILYFIFMLLTMLTWARYIVAYLNKSGRGSKALLHGITVLFVFGLIYLLCNQFFHFIFYFNADHEYVPGPGRYIAFIIQISFYAVTAMYMLVIAHKTLGRYKVKYIAVAMTSVVMGLFQLFQTLYPLLPFYAMGLLVGTCLVHSFVEAGEKKEKEIKDNIASVMAKDYKAIYYIDFKTGEYLELAKSDRPEAADPAVGKDFFLDAREIAAENVYPEDKEFVKSFYQKETMLKNLEGKRSFSCKYRVMVNEVPRYFLITYMPAGDDEHIILYEKDIDDELMAEKKRKESHKKTVTFSQIAESLASNYDEIYYVDVASSSYVGYEFNNHGQLQISKSGEDFYKEFVEVIPQIAHKQDRDMLVDFMNRDNMISAMEGRKGCSIDYRVRVGGHYRYLRMLVRKSSDEKHFIIGIEDIDAEVKKEKQHIRALKAEKELARRDELTGVKNKTAYIELEASVQNNMDNGMDYLPFALVVCDTNNLKQVNDTHGHMAGDEYIKASAKFLCDIFVHSPVFRVGGDEFVIFLRGDDFTARKKLMENLQEQVLDNIKTGKGIILASGMADYDPNIDSLVSDIFDRADKEMYENKQKLKEL